MSREEAAIKKALEMMRTAPEVKIHASIQIKDLDGDKCYDNFEELAAQWGPGTKVNVEIFVSCGLRISDEIEIPRQ